MGTPITTEITNVTARIVSISTLYPARERVFALAGVASWISMRRLPTGIAR
jgi:hypothetical protein